jgi:hypothetical protein
MPMSEFGREDDFEGLKFVYMGNQLRSVCYAGWPFLIDETGIGYPGGYPMPEALLDSVVGKGQTGRQLNEEMNLARDICIEAYPRYLASLQG